MGDEALGKFHLLDEVPESLGLVVAGEGQGHGRFFVNSPFELRFHTQFSFCCPVTGSNDRQQPQQNS